MATPAHSAENNEISHVMPRTHLWGVWTLLIALTVVTVLVVKVDLGALNIWIAMAIATVKAVFVALFFMHLVYDRPFNGVILACTLLFVLLFIGGALTDTEHYQPEMMPDYQPLIDQMK